MTSSTSRHELPRVLAFADVLQSLVAAARVHAPLRALREAGLIGDFVVTDSTLRGAPRNGHFDVIWMQRATDAWLAGTLADRLAERYLLDVDDHLLCLPSYLEPRDLPAGKPFAAALAGCRVLTTPSARLRTLLETRSRLDLRERAHACPNAIPFRGLAVPLPSRPQAILLTQAHRLALTASADAILTALAESAARHRLPLWVLGAMPPGLQERAVETGASLFALTPRTWHEYHSALAGRPTLLGVAPLETRGDPDTLEFVNGKSDIKMVEFGGFGHPAVYSRSAPYEDTDLACGRLALNTRDDWAAAIDEVLSGGWRTAGEESGAIRERRDLSRVAVEHWWPAVQAARLQEPVQGATLFSELERARSRLRDLAARARWHLAAWRKLGP